MSATRSDPWEFASLGELLAMAKLMEREAIESYLALSRRMAAMRHPDLARVFDSLALEETEHLSKVEEWREASGLRGAVEVEVPEDLFDDEGAGIIAPELLSAYRAFSMAVRNEERAFMFWTYVSAHAHSDEIRQAAERMAREELGHVAKLRRERRKAFHLERAAIADVDTDLVSLEETLARQLDGMANEMSGDVANVLRGHSQAAGARAESMTGRSFHPSAVRKTRVQESIIARPLPLCEHLLDCYLDLGEHSRTEHDADRARSFAAELIACIRTVRSLQN